MPVGLKVEADVINIVCAVYFQFFLQRNYLLALPLVASYVTLGVRWDGVNCILKQSFHG